MILTIVSFILVLSILVFFHELGHYLAARHVGVRVQRFSIGFPPRAFGIQRGDTEWVVSWLPLGGYVKLLGQNIDDEDPSDPHNYAAKSKLQRLYILAAGPAMNLVLAFVIMPFVYMIGVDLPSYRKAPPVIHSVTEGSPAQTTGFHPGDQIVAVGSEETLTWDDVYQAVSTEALSSSGVTFSALRDGVNWTIVVPGSRFTSNTPFGWQPRIPPVVGAFGGGASAAEAAGLLVHDRILSIDGTAIESWSQMPGIIQKTEGQPLNFKVERGRESLEITISPRYSDATKTWLVGITQGTVTERFGPIEAVKHGVGRVWDILGATFAFLWQIVSGNGSMDAVGGPVRIGAVIGEAARTGIANVVFLMSIISLQLGIFNLLPIPALDGGHIFMLGMEKLNGKPLSATFRERAQLIGFSLLMMMILFVTYNDVLSLLS